MKALLFSLFLVLAAASSAAAQTAAKDSKPKKSSTTKQARTLDEIQIEGEVDMPQVLFITARERYRTMDHLHRRYLKSCSQVGRDARLAKRLGRGQNSDVGNLSKEN